MSKIAPPRFMIFLVLLVVGIGLFVWLWHPLKGIMAGFDIAAATFLLSSLPLVDDKAHQMRKRAKENDANKAALLAISVAVTTVILVAVGAVIAGARSLERVDVMLIFGTLSLAWLLGNTVYAFHYAHMYYSRNKGERRDAGGIDFTGTEEPSYWDFFYFAFTLGMTFQTSDSNVTNSAMRRVVVAHSFAGFVYNIGVLAFTINVLGG